MATLYQISILCFNLLFFLTSLTLANTQTPTPFEAKWSSATFGPDGPWQAVSVTLGADTDLALYPGHTFQSWIIQTSYCKFNNSNGCYASKAGTYNSAEASQVGSGSTSGIVFRPHIKNWMIGIDPAGESAQFWVDRIRLKSGTSDAVQQVENTSLALLEDQMLTYPGGQWYPAFAGCLGVGAPNMINQSFSTGTYPINASLIPGMLWTQQDIPSNSFSMHIGSVWSRIGGSLIFGGYDQNRLTGEVLVSEGDYTDNPITLRDISIEVIQGISPFNFTTQDGLRQDGLLAAGNNSIQNGLLVSIDGCAPYLTLPKSTCDNIASHLPVTYDTNLGLYLWDTESTAYIRIVSSASTLSFTFLSGTNTEPLTIRVPFLHLNLTLSEPLTAKPTPYFPCFNSGSGRYALGRAFLQDAFLGANWGQSKWWLGQAPGPNIQLSSSVVAIEEAGTVIKAGNNDWEESWKGIWKVLGPDSDSGTSPTESPTDNRQPTSAPASTISTGAIAGIAVGGVAVVIALGLGVVFWRRRNRRGGRASTMKREPPQHKHDSLQYDSRPPPQTEPAEVYGSISIYKWRNRNGKQIDSPEDPRISRVELP